jgi:hypothetical protein
VPSLRGGEEFVVVDGGFDNVEVSLLEERCAFWRSLGRKIPV